LHLASVLMRSPNFLILDEPTNDLDIVTLGLLEEYLKDFKGCVIIVSHDRFFLDCIVDHIFVFEGQGKVRDFPGGYSDYRQWRDSQAKAAATTTPSKPDQRQRAERKVKLTWAERRELEALTTEIDNLTAERRELEAAFQSGDPSTDIVALSARYEQVKNLLDEKEMRWLELSEKE
jgi:ATP-binding cassette subfamily F protein uup